MNGAFVSWCASIAQGRSRAMSREEIELALRAWNAAIYYAGLHVGRLTATEEEGPVASHASFLSGSKES